VGTITIRGQRWRPCNVKSLLEAKVATM